MGDPVKGIPRNTLARLSQSGERELEALLDTPHPNYKDVTLGEMALPSALRGHYSLADALAIELARQLSDYYGLSLPAALQAVAYTGAIEHYQNAGKGEDFWIGVTGTRNTWGDSERGSVPVTSFGPSEFWSTMHFHGSFGDVTGQVKAQMERDSAEYPHSDFARLFMANVSAADRRLQKRIGDLGLTDFGLE